MGQITTTKNQIPAQVEEDDSQNSNDWFARGLCRDIDPDEFFVETHNEQKQARTLCFECPVRVECLADALDNRIEFGVWGGMTERERRALLRRSPNVADWFPILRQIQDQQDAWREKAREKLAELWRAKRERENGALERTNGTNPRRV